MSENSSSSTNTSLSSLTSILECQLCLNLICEPVSISCGHSFCKVCLAKSLKHRKKCPICRAVCHTIPEIAQENIMIKGLCLATNPIEYQTRLIECQKEKDSWASMLPIFLLQ